jgi:hypothetical protein
MINWLVVLIAMLFSAASAVFTIKLMYRLKEKKRLKMIKELCHDIHKYYGLV